MTQRRNDPDSLTNYFDRLLTGIGHRNSSFTDVDRIDVAPVVCTHNMKTDRFLVQEFKQHNEKVKRGQELTLEALARLQTHTVWLVVKRQDGDLDWFDYASSDGTEMATISTNEYRSLCQRWWNSQPIRGPRRELRTEDIPLVTEN